MIYMISRANWAVVSSCSVVTMTSVSRQTTDVRGMCVLQRKLMIETPCILKYRILPKV